MRTPLCLQLASTHVSWLTLTECDRNSHAQREAFIIRVDSGSTPSLRTLQRSPIMGKRSVYAEEKKIQFGVQTRGCERWLI